MIFILETFISNWLKDILVVFIVISFLEIILPKGKMKKFVNFIIGLLIIFVVISPFIDLNSVQLNFDMNTDELMNDSETQAIINDQEARIKKVFTNSLNDEVKRLVEENSNYEVTNINIDTKEEQDTLLIQEVSITIKNSEDSKRGEIMIDQIQVVENSEPEVENNHEDIRNLISDYLGIEMNIIHISIVD